MLAQELPDIDILVAMATEFKLFALHEFLLQKCKEQTDEFTEKFRLKGNTPKVKEFKKEINSIINEGGNYSSEILKILQLGDKDLTQALKNRKN